jgi:hypothetical protein
MALTDLVAVPAGINQNVRNARQATMLALLGNPRDSYDQECREITNPRLAEPPGNFHGLRHTYASRLAMKGVPLAVIAAQLGHADTRMVEKHYGHLSPSYVTETVRAAFGSLGIVEPSNVAPIAAAR